ncbi:MAG: hypothetical protein IJ153_03295 [Clostridia bacterium]|nr:hypothetical protein [Clostridia bacterium]
MKFLAWILSLIFAFNLGAGTTTESQKSDEELRNRVQEHIDTIVDEGAAIVDEITDEIRNDERVQEAEQFIQDVQDVAEETLKDLNKVYEDAKDRVEEKFGAEEVETEEAPETVEEEEKPGPDEPVNG